VRFDDGDGFLVANLLAFESASTIGIGAALAMKVDDVLCRIGGCGCGCTRKVASGTRCSAPERRRRFPTIRW
jgi:hypothetical protein